MVSASGAGESPDPSTSGVVSGLDSSVVVVGGTVVVSGHPSLSSPSAGVNLSGQQPNSDSAHWDLGHPLWFLPLAGDTPSRQQPNLVSAQVLAMGQPSSKGPLGVDLPSGQQPYLDLAQLLFLGLHLRGLSLVTVDSKE